MSDSRLVRAIRASRGPGFSSPIAYAWVVVALSAVVHGATTGVYHSLPLLYPFIQDDLSLSRAQVGLITSALAAGSLSTAFLGGWLTDVLGVKRVSLGAMALVALPILGLTLAHSLWPVLALALLAGMAVAPGYPVSSRAIMEWVPRATRGLAMSLKQTGVPIVGAAAAGALPAIAVVAGWRMGAVALAAVTLVAAVVVLGVYRDRPREGRGGGRFNLATLRALTRERRLLWPTLWAWAFMGLQYIVGTYLILFLIEEIGLSPVAAGGFIAIAQMANLGARVLWGALSDFVFGGRRIVVLGILGMVATAGLTGAGLTNEGTPMVLTGLVAATLGATVISWHGVLTVFVGEVVGVRQSGTAIGAVNTVMRVAMMAVPPLFGLLVDMSGSYPVGWMVAATLAFAATAALILLGKEGQRS